MAGDWSCSSQQLRIGGASARIVDPGREPSPTRGIEYHL
jgi:hypothetical protein